MQLQENVKKSHRQCKKCNILTSGKFTRQDLQKWKVKDLRCVLHKRNISTETCREKHDLIDLLVITFGVVSQNNSEERSSSSSQSTVSFIHLIVWVNCIVYRKLLKKIHLNKTAPQGVQLRDHLIIWV